MKKNIIHIILFLSGLTFSQNNELIIEDGAEFNIPLGSQITSDIITVNLNAIFISDDPSAIADGTTIQGDVAGVLPVELYSFTANVFDNRVLLNWITITETNNYGFVIQRSCTKNDKPEWEKIGFVNGSGNSNSSKQYSFTDQNLIGSNRFKYRLKQIDNDGTSKFSELLEVEVIPNKFELFQNYPNPFNPSTKIRYQLPFESRVSIKIYDILGEEILELINENKQPGIYEVEFKADNLSSSTYFYRIITDYFTETRKMILLR